MSKPSLREEILREVDRLPLGMQRRVLLFAQTLVQTEPKGMPWSEFLTRFGGSISNEDADIMERAIEESCEQVEPDEW